MSYFADVLIIIFLFLIFGLLHSLLAANSFKRRLEDKIGDKIAFYRLFYNLVSTLSYVLIIGISPRPDLIVYDLPYPWDIIIYVLQVTSLAGIIWSVMYVDLKEFLGINQVIRYYRGKYNSANLDENSSLIIRGPFRYMRHPAYFFFILFLGLRPVMSLFYLTAYIATVVYFIIGAIFEERKLAEKFGVEYKMYQKNVPRFIPLKISAEK